MHTLKGLLLRPFIIGTIAVSLSLSALWKKHWLTMKILFVKYLVVLVVITTYFDEINLAWPHMQINCLIIVVPPKVNLFQPENINLQIWKIVKLVRQSTSRILLKYLERWNKKSTQQFSRPKVIFTKLKDRVHLFLQVLISVKIVWGFRVFFAFDYLNHLSKNFIT